MEDRQGKPADDAGNEGGSGVPFHGKGIVGAVPDLEHQLRNFLSRHGIHLQRDLGQHFLIHEEILQMIVSAANIAPDSTVVEIGPGVGILTKELTKRARKVIAIEIDKRFPPLLQEWTNHAPNVEIVQGNALKVPFPQEPYQIVANIPYHITSPLLRHAFLESPVGPTSMTLLIQREVAEKICDTKHRGLLTILVGLFGTAKIMTHVPSEAFLPPPAVDSSVLRIDCYPEPLANAEVLDRVFKLTKMAFTHKRKMLRKSFGALPTGMALLEQAGIASDRRPETLSVEEWLTLARSAEQ